MRLKKLFADEEAVSPVIGVILMVAITVILAAVIASFVLGLGQQTGNVAPKAQFSVDYTDGDPASNNWDGNLSVTHNSGDTIVANRLFFRGSGLTNTSGALSGEGNVSWAAFQDEGLATTSTTKENVPAVTSGDEADFGAESNYDLNLVWEAEEGDTSSTLVSDSGPDA